MSRCSAPTEMLLFVSLPSEMIRSAFFVCRPESAIATASATASYNAVPPQGAMRATARLTVAGPGLHDVGPVGEPQDEDLAVFAEQVADEPVDRGSRGRHLVRRHAPTGVERYPETDGDALIAENPSLPAARHPRTR